MVGRGDVHRGDDGGQGGAGVLGDDLVVFRLGVGGHHGPQGALLVEVGAQDEADRDGVEELAGLEGGGVLGDGGGLDLRLGEDVADDVVEVGLAVGGDRREGEGLAGHEVDVVVGDGVGAAVEEAAERVGPLVGEEGGLVEQLALLEGALADRVGRVGHSGEHHVVGADGACPKGQGVVGQGLDVLGAELHRVVAHAQGDAAVAGVDQGVAHLVGDGDVDPRREGVGLWRDGQDGGEGDGEAGGEDRAASHGRRPS